MTQGDHLVKVEELMSIAELVGAAAAALSMFSFAPQALRVLRTGDTAAISLWSFVVIVTSAALWLAYGLMLASPPLIAANLVNGSFASFVLFRKLTARSAR